jgi:hypothetical protein
MSVLLLATAISASWADGPLRPQGCPVGAPAESRSADLSPVTPPVLIGCGELRKRGAFKLVGYRVADGGSRTVLCLEAQYANSTDVSYLCPLRLRPRHVWLTFSSDDTGWTFAGTASLRVRRIALRYWSYGHLKRGSLDLVSVTDPAALNALGLKRPFSYFEAEAPDSLKRFKLIARGARSQVLERRYIDLRD